MGSVGSGPGVRSRRCEQARAGVATPDCRVGGIPAADGRRGAEGIVGRCPPRAAGVLKPEESGLGIIVLPACLFVFFFPHSP